MLQAAMKEKVVVEEENLKDKERRINEEKVKSWKEKALHDEFVVTVVFVTCNVNMSFSG